MTYDKTKAIAHLEKDPVLAKIIASTIPYELTSRKNICVRLCASIMSQQLSTKVADVIFKRFLELYDNKEPQPKEILATPFEQLKGIGLSGAKTSYVLNVASYFEEHNLSDVKVSKLDDKQVMELLLPIKGVGIWTVEMLLMFALGRADVFAADDLGIQQAMCRLYELDPNNKKQITANMKAIAEKWMPYRTIACFYLWKYKDSDK